MSHIMGDGQERPVAYVSGELSPQLKRTIHNLKKKLLLSFLLPQLHFMAISLSDHRPLSLLFDEKKRVPQMASSRIQRWALTLSAYQYTIRYKPGKKLCNADALSRLPSPVTTSQEHFPEDLALLVNHLSATSIGQQISRVDNERPHPFVCVEASYEWMAR